MIRESQCKYYVWRGSTRRKQCILESSGLWVPKYEEGTISGTVDEPTCREQTVNDYGFCDCVEFEPDYYDPDFVDLVETGSTLKANGLVEVEKICEVSTRLAVNRSYMKTNLKTIQPWIEKVEEAINV